MSSTWYKVLFVGLQDFLAPLGPSSIVTKQTYVAHGLGLKCFPLSISDVAMDLSILPDLTLYINLY